MINEPAKMSMMKYKAQIIAFLMILGPLFGNAQDGEGLFKSKCNTCHILGDDGTGPNLKGVAAKWESAGEKEFLYRWVKNSQNLIASGESTMAAKIENYSSSAMSVQSVSDEEIDAILSYIDNYVPAPPPPPKSAKGEAEVTYVPDYNSNLDLFYALLCTLILLLITIIILSGTMLRFIKSDYYKKKSNNSNLKTLLLLVGFSIAFSNTGNALTMLEHGEATESIPWLKVENMDIYVLVFINLILVFVVFYLKRMLKVFFNIAMPPEEKEAEEPVEVIKKVNQILTDVVPIEEEHTILLHHEYDGIKELDNNLPPWWVWLFYATIVFGVIYIFNYHILGTGDLQEAEYDKSMKQAELEMDAYRKANAMDITSENVILLTESEDMKIGKKLFSSVCATCHGDKGEGSTGPNLTDKAWIYGYDISDVFMSIQKGRPGGMQSWETKFNPIQIQQIGSYVLSMPEAKGKEPQGEIIEK
ncbi:MAG: cytochrome c oxidase cbb3-type subunit 3 [Crocinitomicaceae bacterium]|jgi:cytochrome c oxidase cbb3-type subunit 3